VWQLPSFISKCFFAVSTGLYPRLSNFTGLRFKMDRLCSRKTPLSSLLHVKWLVQAAVAHKYKHSLPRFGCFFTNPIAANIFRVFGSDDESNSTDQSPHGPIRRSAMRLCYQSATNQSPQSARQMAANRCWRKGLPHPSTSPTSMWLNLQPQRTLLRCVTC